MANKSQLLFQAIGIGKSYGHVTALAGVDLAIRRGEILALVGDNGAGKSTLVKILSGAIAPSEGVLKVEGAEVAFTSPADAAKAGIQTVYQDLALAGDLSIAGNIYLGRELVKPGVVGRFGFLDQLAMRHGTETTLERLGIRLKSVNTRVSDLSGGQRQSVAIARALTWASSIVILDEPTAALGVAQTKQVLELLRRVRSMGLGVVVISHNMQDVLSVADRVIVLRLGRKAAEFDRRGLSVESLIAAITGADKVGVESASEEK